MLTLEQIREQVDVLSALLGDEEWLEHTEEQLARLEAERAKESGTGPRR